jgi:hypothetical protein
MSMELFSHVWMEIVMFAIAAVGYILFSGGLPMFQVPAEKATKKVADESKGQPEEEKIEKELLTKLQDGDHQQNGSERQINWKLAQ